jgi:N-acetylglucosamine kinase-like BadF-type ATPase
MVYSGTGSVAAFVDAKACCIALAGRGVVVDDGGSGFWIAREAMRRVWRIEDEAPGSWRDSPLAVALFDAVGGSDWAHSREYIYGGDRGAVGRLSLAVANAASAKDPAAREILAEAGRELARLATAMTKRYGPRPVALAGRAASIHPLIFENMRAARSAETPLEIPHRPRPSRGGAPRPEEDRHMTSSWMLGRGLLLRGHGRFVKYGAEHFDAGEMAFYRSFVGLIFISALVAYAAARCGPRTSAAT